MREKPCACWYCALINRCEPVVRPRKRADCPYFKDFGYKLITQEQVAEHLKIERHQLSWILKRYGITPVIELLKTRERYVRYEYELCSGTLHFYEIKI